MNNLVCLINGHTKLPDEKGFVECPRCHTPFCWGYPDDDVVSHERYPYHTTHKGWYECKHVGCNRRRLHKNRRDWPRTSLELELKITLKYNK